jgi:hypothetical protein
MRKRVRNPLSHVLEECRKSESSSDALARCDYNKCEHARNRCEQNELHTPDGRESGDKLPDG